MKIAWISRIRPICWLAAILSAAVCVIAFSMPLLATDTACRYAPMAEAFASGEWSEAFHPRFGIGSQILSGILVFLTPLDGYSACAVAASIAWALCVIPLYDIGEQTFGRLAAWLAVGIFLIYPQTLIWGLKGLREPYKILGILLAADALLSLDRDNGKALAKSLVSVVLLILFKVDAIVLAFAFVAAMLVMDRCGRRSLITAAVAAVALQPMCWLVYHWHGWWLPAPQYISVFERILRGVGM